MIQQVRFGRQYQIKPKDGAEKLNFDQAAHFLRSLNQNGNKPAVITSNVKELVNALNILSEIIKLPKEDFICKAIIENKNSSDTIQVLTDDATDETTDKSDFMKGFSKAISEGQRDEYVSSTINQVNTTLKNQVKSQSYDDIAIFKNQLETIEFPFDKEGK